MGTRSLLGLSFVLLIALPSTPKAEAATAPDAAGYITDLGGRVLKLLQDKRSPEPERKLQFRELADRAFDVPKIARFVLGHYWVTAGEAERQQFVKAFEDYMVQVYWSYFGQYRAEGIMVLAQRELGANSVRVTTQIMRPDGQVPAKVDWTITAQGDTYKIIDVNIEGVSQALTYRDQFASIISRNGGDVAALIDDLRRKAGS